MLLFVWRLHGRLRRDRFRTNIRYLRDSLFDYMWKNGYSFDTPAYVETRRTLNGMLRASNWISPVTFLLTAFYAKRASASQSPLFEAIKAVEDEPLRSQLMKTIDDAVYRMVRFLFLETIVGRILLLVSGLKSRINLINRVLSNIRKWVFAAARTVLDDFYVFGEPSPRSGLVRLLR
jgi:hypothetical protein